MSKSKKETKAGVPFENADPLTPDMEFIRKELKYLRNAIDRQNNSISTITAMLRELIREEVILGKQENNKIAFPIETDTDLEELEKEVVESPGKYSETFRDMIFGRGGLEKNLKCILSAEVALHYNWDGTSGKKAFKNLKHLNEALYNAIKPEISSPEVYKKAIRQGLKRIKNLHFKKVSLQKKQDLKVINDEIISF